MSQPDRWHPFFLMLVLSFSLSMSACTPMLDLYSGLSEQDANELIAALKEGGISSQKQGAKTGFIIKVSEAELASAVSLLRSQGLPRHTFVRMGDIFKKDGMISTPTEERGRYLYALSQELENTLTQIDGVILARVHPVLPERIVPGEPVQPSSCSVLIKHRHQWNPRLYEDRIRRLLVSSIPGLSKALPTAVSIVFVPVQDESDEVSRVKPRPEVDGRHDPMRWGAMVLLVIGSLLCLVLLLRGYSGPLFQWWMKLRNAESK
jgi:type III secretion protein J